MKIKLTRTVIFLLLGITVSLCSCGNSAQPVSNSSSPNGSQQAVANTGPAASAPTGGGSSSTSTPGGEPIDTSRYDAEVESARKQAERKPNDPAARSALAHAYLARANALRDARQYRVALGDYRRTLQYDPENRDAQQNAAMIIMIMKQMGREVPEPGQEPTPLPYGGNAAARQGAPASNSSAPLLKSH